MKIISPANKTVLQILKNFRKPSTKYRKLAYLIHTEVEEGILLFNLLTRELLLLEKEEYQNATENEYLRQQWFIVPEEYQEKEYIDFARDFIKNTQKTKDNIKNYTIFTTTDCNARCFYCFEHGSVKKHMSTEVADQIVTYITEKSKGDSVNISWFGGEPLYNKHVIDIICTGLVKNGIKFKSRMTSNGYLIDDEVIRKAKELWNLKKIQITLDGTETVYNKIKAYIYDNVNPYQIVMKNIEKMANSEIHVSIRLNMDLYNANDLLALCDELGKKFSHNKYVTVYAHHLFSEGKTMTELHTPEEWECRDNAMIKIEDKLNSYGLQPSVKISQDVKLHRCMADSNNSITILPDGKIGKCEHHLDTMLIGDLNNQNYDDEIINKWKKKSSEIPECKDCYYYPDCIKLEYCTNEKTCNEHFRNDIRRKIIAAIKNTFNNSEV